MIDIESFKAARKAAKLTQSELAQKVGAAQQLIGHIETGRVLTTQYIFKIAEVLNVSASELDPDIPIGVRQPSFIPLVGYVGAGAEIFTIDDHAKGAGLEEVEMPPGGASSNTIAVRVRGDSMVPAYEDGDIIYYDDKVEGDFSSMIGKRCLVKLADGRMFIKKLMRSNGSYWLYSHNAEPIVNPQIQWVAKVLWAKQD